MHMYSVVERMLLCTALFILLLSIGSQGQGVALPTDPSAITTAQISSSVIDRCTGCFVLQSINVEVIGSSTAYETSDGSTLSYANAYMTSVGAISYDDFGYLGASLTTALGPISGTLFTILGVPITSPTAYYYFGDNIVITRMLTNRICTTSPVFVLHFQDGISIPGGSGDLQQMQSEMPSIFATFQSLAGISTPICSQNILKPSSSLTQATTATTSLNSTIISTSSSSTSISETTPPEQQQSLSQSARIGIGVGLGVACSLAAFMLLIFVRRRRKAAAELDGGESYTIETDGRSKSELDSYGLAVEKDGRVRHELKADVPMYELAADEISQLKHRTVETITSR